MKQIVIIGSINMDVINRVKKHPVPGETIKSFSTAYMPGGKGANQAVAAARSGARVAMAGAVGSDAFASELVASLRASGVDTGFVLRKEGTSGLAFITVDESGENNIILAEGANGALTPEDLAPVWERPELLAILLQNEIPWETNREAMHKAKERGVRVIFNPAPAMSLPADMLPYIGTLVLNQSEAEQVTGLRAERPDEAERAAEQLIASGVGEVIITLGAEGSLYMNKQGERIFTPAFRVQAVDTTAAGDTFIGAFAASLAAGKAVRDALVFASAAAALTVTRKGAQESIPDADEIERFLQQNQ
ncbi:ribokinase [Paenibacillus hamazuiensis]|uniref:ribokinase n=1 Tax=Paenibacillus hamazuiensis TaxID=2936508 RepID=UPI00200CEB7A|nr:ribokinase [Paenibacillus hamazuiensis]